MKRGLHKIVVLIVLAEMLSMASCWLLNTGNNLGSPLLTNSVETNTNSVNQVFGNNVPYYVHNVETLPDDKTTTGSNQETFEQAVVKMSNFLQGGDEPCSMYDPPTPNFAFPGRRVSETKCLENIWRVKKEEEMGKRVAKCQAKYGGLVGIIGGRVAKSGEFPHMGAIGWEKKDRKDGDWSFLCGSFLVSDKFVLTAAHCQTSQSKDVAHPRPKIVRFGVVNIKNDKSNTPVDIKILKFTKYPCYRPHPYKAHDIAIVELAKRVSFDSSIQPACLLDREVPTAIVTGWGVVDSVMDSQRTSDDLLETEVDIVPSKRCTRKLRAKQDKYWRVQESQICAIRTNSDTCSGDSGGPLQSKLLVNTKKSIYNVVGVTSFGFICGRSRFPSIYTKVSSYLDWIEDTVWPNKMKPAKYISCPFDNANKVYNANALS